MLAFLSSVWWWLLSGASPCPLVQGDGVGVWQWGCSAGGCVLAEELQQEHPSPLPSWEMGWGAVDLHLHPWRELCGGQAGVVREPHPLAHHQMFIKCVVWVEFYAGFSVVAKKSGMQPAAELSHHPFGDVLPANWWNVTKGKIRVLNTCSLVTLGVEAFCHVDSLVAVASLALPWLC